MKRSTAFLINGGAGRVLCSIPALELYEIQNPTDDFIIIVEYWIDLFKGHPTLYKRCYDYSHKNLFKDKLKDRQLVSPEPYHTWEYYNQKASIAQGFDIAINNNGLRNLPRPTIRLSNIERQGGTGTLDAIKKDNGNKKIIVFQPFGRGTSIQNNEVSADMFGKSFFIEDVATIIKKLQTKYTVVLMTESTLTFNSSVKVVQLPNFSVRQWCAIINSADYFLGCDSLGQHIAHSFFKPATIVLGGTFKENVSYPNDDKFNIVDVGYGLKEYSPIRACYDELADLANENLMRLTSNQIDDIIETFNRNI